MAQAERVSGWIRVHTKISRRCRRGRVDRIDRAPSERKHPLVRGDNVGDEEVNVRLLRNVILRPGRRHVVGRELEAHLRPGPGDRDPVVIAVRGDGVAEQIRVEGGQGPRVRAVESQSVEDRSITHALRLVWECWEYR